MAPISIIWFRRDLRLLDHNALAAAAARGPVVPVYIYDAHVDALGAASKWRLEQSLRSFSAQLNRLGLSLCLRRGDPLVILRDLIAQTGADAVFWSRSYDPAVQETDRAVKSALKSDGIDAQSFRGHLLFEPWAVQNKTGSEYKVYTPYWKAVRDLPVDGLRAAPALRGVDFPVQSDVLADWNLSGPMNRGGAVLAQHHAAGEPAALAALDRFVTGPVSVYKAERDFLDRDVCSGLSEYLTWGEISPRRAWFAGKEAMTDGAAGAEHFLKEICWREFAYHLFHRAPDMAVKNWRPEWEAFPWQNDPDAPAFLAWCQGRTGIKLVDAAMREVYVTGKMHNRARMIVASYLTKHLLIDWRLGLRWFQDVLTDWDPASNAMGWQWVAGSGPDAAPYFRVFNPDTQAEKFDPAGAYRHRWLAEITDDPPRSALEFFDACPRCWGMNADQDYPTEPVMGLQQGRVRALEAYTNRIT